MGFELYLATPVSTEPFCEALNVPLTGESYQHIELHALVDSKIGEICLSFQLGHLEEALVLCSTASD